MNSEGESVQKPSEQHKGKFQFLKEGVGKLLGRKKAPESAGQQQSEPSQFQSLEDVRKDLQNIPQDELPVFSPSWISEQPSMPAAQLSVNEQGKEALPQESVPGVGALGATDELERKEITSETDQLITDLGIEPSAAPSVPSNSENVFKTLRKEHEEISRQNPIDTDVPPFLRDSIKTAPVSEQGEQEPVQESEVQPSAEPEVPKKEGVLLGEGADRMSGGQPEVAEAGADAGNGDMGESETRPVTIPPILGGYMSGITAERQAENITNIRPEIRELLGKVNLPSELKFEDFIKWKEGREGQNKSFSLKKWFNKRLPGRFIQQGSVREKVIIEAVAEAEQNIASLLAEHVYSYKLPTNNELFAEMGKIFGRDFVEINKLFAEEMSKRISAKKNRGEELDDFDKEWERYASNVLPVNSEQTAENLPTERKLSAEEIKIREFEALIGNIVPKVIAAKEEKMKQAA